MARRRRTPREARKVQDTLDALEVPEVCEATASKPPPPPAETKGAKPPRADIPYSPELGSRICTLLAQGCTLNEICGRADMPDESAVRQWALDGAHPFSPSYARARLIGYHKMADDIIEIVDNSTNDWMQRAVAEGVVETVVDREHISRTELRFRARQWLLSKALPKIYGDKLIVTREVDDVSQLSIAEIRDELARRRSARAEAGAPIIGPGMPEEPAGVVH